MNILVTGRHNKTGDTHKFSNNAGDSKEDAEKIVLDLLNVVYESYVNGSAAALRVGSTIINVSHYSYIQIHIK